ncbi:uncharacterized protein [Dipodomys merriami]|uniref:uncharacterized protein isoform X3 n=1 Tax=Dipodomys merriami TaxID=94247 RepID=UPI003855F0EE
MASRSTLAFSEQVEYLISWEEDRKFILRGWCFIFIILATLLMFSVGDGRMAYLQGPYTGYLGFWTNCRRHRCANVGQVTVLIHMSKGFMLLALGLCFLLLPIIIFSFRPVFRRLVKIDFVFSSLSISIGGLSYLNQVGLWSRRMPTMERRMSYRRWAFQQGAVGRLSQQQDSDPEQTEDSSFSDQGDTQDPTTKNSSAIQNTEL